METKNLHRDDGKTFFSSTFPNADTVSDECGGVSKIYLLLVYNSRHLVSPLFLFHRFSTASGAFSTELSTFRSFTQFSHLCVNI